jgi:hypothetical protein
MLYTNCVFLSTYVGYCVVALSCFLYAETLLVEYLQVGFVYDMNDFIYNFFLLYI